MGTSLATAALGWLAVTATQAGAAAESAPAELALWRLDCGEFVVPDSNAFFSDTLDYPSEPKRIVDSCYIDRFRRIVRNLDARTIIQHEPADVAKLPAFPEAAR